MSDDTPDPITVLRIHLAGDPPGRALFAVGRRSIAARLAAGAEGADEVTDLGPAALLLTQRYERKREALGAGLMRVGVAEGDRWLAWFLPSRAVEPVPGSPGAAAQRN